jgi:hypothetical protein
MLPDDDDFGGQEPARPLLEQRPALFQATPRAGVGFGDEAANGEVELPRVAHGLVYAGFVSSLWRRRGSGEKEHP